MLSCLVWASRHNGALATAAKHAGLIRIVELGELLIARPWGCPSQNSARRRSRILPSVLGKSQDMGGTIRHLSFSRILIFCRFSNRKLLDVAVLDCVTFSFFARVAAPIQNVARQTSLCPRPGYGHHFRATAVWRSRETHCRWTIIIPFFDACFQAIHNFDCRWSRVLAM